MQDGASVGTKVVSVGTEGVSVGTKDVSVYREGVSVGKSLLLYIRIVLLYGNCVPLGHYAGISGKSLPTF